MSSEKGYGTVAAIFVSIIWGLSFVAASMVLTTLSPVILATLRFMIASLIYSPVIVWEYRKRNRQTLADLKDLALLGFLSISIYFWLQYTGVQYAGAGISAILVTGLIPVLTGLSGTVLLKERFNLKKGFGIAIGLTGVSLIALPKLILGNIDWLFFIGVAFLLGNAVCFSMYSTLSRRLLKRIGKPLIVTAYTTLLGMLFLLPMSLFSDWQTLSSLATEQWWSILYLAIICSSGGYLLWNYALSKIEAVKVSVWLYLEPVAAFVGSFALFGSVPTPLTLLGGSVIMVGALLTSLSKQ